MATVDMTQRKLNFPPRFLPYLEKHRIFELFHECIELLVQVRPRDHIQFLKNVLPCAARKKDKQRIVFLAPPHFDRETFGYLIADCLGIQPVDRLFMELLTKDRLKKEEVQIIESEEKLIESEESCICPGEEGPQFIYPLYYPAPEEPLFSDREEEKETVKEEEIPCICVCPCVANQNKENDVGAQDEYKEDKGTEKDEESEKSKLREEGERSWEGEGEGMQLPCDGDRRSKAKVSTAFSSEGEITPPIDYGILAECEVSARGWILIDFPLEGEEAEKLCQLGVLPTHAIRIILDEDQEMKDKKYKWTVFNWMKIYKFLPVTVIKMERRSMEQFSSDVCKLLSIMPHRHPPMLPRIALIGSRGSGVTTQAEKLAKKYGMVHVEFDDVIAKALKQDDDIVKFYKQQMMTRIEPEVEAYLLEKALLAPRCVNRGWILTGYPRNLDDMRMLDIIATPPNRVIFLEVPARECFVRLFYRKFDPCLGDEYKIPKIEPFGLDLYKTVGLEPEVADRLVTHPKNNKKQIVHDIETYFIQKKEMINYCGKTASYVDGNKPVDVVFELIEKIIADPAPAQPPRDPLFIKYGIEESYRRLKQFRLATGLYFNNMLLNPPHTDVRL